MQSSLVIYVKEISLVLPISRSYPSSSTRLLILIDHFPTSPLEASP